MEKPLPTLKVARYRRLNYVVRHLYGEVFEILVYHKGSFHSHTHTFTRGKNLKKTPYKQAELATITHALNEMATILIDDIIFQWKAYRWDRWVENLKGRGRYLVYWSSETKDKLTSSFKLWLKKVRKNGENMLVKEEKDLEVGKQIPLKDQK